MGADHIRQFGNGFIRAAPCAAALAAVVVRPHVVHGQLALPAPAIWHVNSTAAGDSGHDRYPSVAADAFGHVVAVWESGENLNGTIGTDLDIFVSTSADGGVTWTDAAVLNSTASDDGSSIDSGPRVAVSAAGTWIAVWSTDNLLGASPPLDRDIAFARSTNNGVTWSPVQRLNTPGNSDSRGDELATVICLGGDEWLAAWRTLDSQAGTIGTDGDIICARSHDDGLTWDAPSPLNTNAGSDSGLDSSPELAIDSQARLVAVWRSTTNLGGTGTDANIFCASSVDGGVVWTAPVVVNSTAFSDGPAVDERPRIATYPAGRRRAYRY